MRYRFFQFLTILGATLTSIHLFLYFKPSNALPDLIVQNTYFGPTSPEPGNPQLIKVQVLVRDSPDLAGDTIKSVSFNQQSIPLKPRDIHGYRGEGSFQLPPGDYGLKWTVQKDKVIWPRTITHEEEVTLSPRDLWVQILIEGNQASIR
jgi:hypothetical protein